MQFGIVLDSQAPTDKSTEWLFEGLLTETRAARDAGFDVLAMGQHYLSDHYHQIQLIPMLARLSAEAPSMAVATGVVLLPFHHPVEIAEQITTLDLIAERAIAGMGAGYRDTEFTNFGIHPSERADRLREGVEVMNLLWTETNANYDGEYYSLTDATINPRPPEKPPVWYAANAKAAVERAAKYGDVWYVNPHSSLTEIRDLKQSYDEIKTDRGESTAVPMVRETYVAPTTAAAYEAAQPYLGPKYESYTDWGQDDAMDDPDELHQPFRELANDRFLIGTPEEVCADLERYHDELNISHVIFRTHWPGMPYDKTKESIELIGDEVIPNL